MAREQLDMFAGIEIGGTKLQVLVADDQLTVLERHIREVNQSRGAEGIRQQIAEIFKNRISRGQSFLACGVGFGGPVDWQTGKILCSHQIDGWNGFELGNWLREILKSPVVVDNDANVGCLAEAERGSGVGKSTVFYMTIGSGIGGGLVQEGRIYHGSAPGETEVGHLRLDRTGTTLESCCSGWAINQRIINRVQDVTKGRLSELVNESPGHEARHLGPAIDAKDSTAIELFEGILEDLAFGISHVSHLLHPNVIILGGGVALLGDKLRSGLQRRLSQYQMEAHRDSVEIRLAKLTADVVPIGALLLARSAMQNDSD